MVLLGPDKIRNAEDVGPGGQRRIGAQVGHVNGILEIHPVGPSGVQHLGECIGYFFKPGQADDGELLARVERVVLVFAVEGRTEDMRGEGFRIEPAHHIGPHLMNVGGQLEEPMELGRPGVVGLGDRSILPAGTHGVGHPVASGDGDSMSDLLLRLGHGQLGARFGRIVEVEIAQLGQTVGELLAQQTIARQRDPRAGGPGHQCRGTGRSTRSSIGGDHVGAVRLGPLCIEHLIIQVQLGPTVVAIGQIDADLNATIGTVGAHRPEQAVKGVGVVGGVGGLDGRNQLAGKRSATGIQIGPNDSVGPQREQRRITQQREGGQVGIGDITAGPTPSDVVAVIEQARISHLGQALDERTIGEIIHAVERQHPRGRCGVSSDP